MSHGRKNSVRDKVIDKSGFIQRKTFHKVWGPSQKVRATGYTPI